MRRIVLIPASLLLAACSSAEIDGPTMAALESWEPLPGRTAEVECGSLFEGWGDGTEEPPLRCWTFEESDGLPASFKELTDSLGEQLGGTEAAPPACMDSSPEFRAVSCTASWQVGDRVVTVTSGLTLTWMQSVVDQGSEVSYTDPTVTGVHEVTLSILDQVPPDDYDIYTSPV